MTEEVEEKMALVIKRGLYCYKIIPFWLKIAYQGLVNRVFKNQIWRNMEVYVDDILVKSIKSDHITDLKELFNELRRYQVKLNLNKCAFGITSRKFLDFMVTQRGIEVNLEEI